MIEASQKRAVSPPHQLKAIFNPIETRAKVEHWPQNVMQGAKTVRQYIILDKIRHTPSKFLSYSSCAPDPTRALYAVTERISHAVSEYSQCIRINIWF